MKKLLALALALVMILGLCACGATEEGGASTGGDEKQTVGILMPTKEQTIWSIQGDRLVEGFEKAGYATLIEYAEDDASKQAMQIENMITKGANVLIIVAVECNHEGNVRLVEYSPMSYENSTMGKIRGKGGVYMNWLVGTLKPYIDENYRTLPDRLNTIIAGSSMGGLMAMYGATVYNHVFQRAACLSPSLWINSGKVLEMIAKSNIRRDTCIYMDYGSEEMFNHAANAEALISTSHLLLTKRVNLAFRIVPGGTHSEASWEKQIPIFMECLGI